MRIIERYSHMGGAEVLESHHQTAWGDIERAIAAVDPVDVKTKKSREKGRESVMLYSPKDMNKVIEDSLHADGWEKLVESSDMLLDSDPRSGQSKREVDFVKDRVGVEVQFGKYAFIAYDFVKFLAFYEEQIINVGVEIMAMHSLQREMSSGVGDWESAMRVLKTRPRGHPPMPLVLVGIGV